MIGVGRVGSFHVVSHISFGMCIAYCVACQFVVVFHIVTLASRGEPLLAVERVPAMMRPRSHAPWGSFGSIVERGAQRRPRHPRHRQTALGAPLVVLDALALLFAPLLVVEAVPVREVLRVAPRPWSRCVIYDTRGPLEASVVAALDAAASEHACKPLTHVGPVHGYPVTGLER